MKLAFTRRPGPFTIRLGAFLVVCGFIGTAIGLYVRSHRPLEPSGCVEEWLLDGFTIHIVWLSAPNGDNRGEFAYLVAQPTGSKPMSYTLRPSGIYIDPRPPGARSRGTNRTAGKPDCKYFIFTSFPEPGVIPVKGPFPHITPRDYDAFKASALWIDYMRPFADRGKPTL